MSEEMSKELHMQAQEKLAQFMLRSKLDQSSAAERDVTGSGQHWCGAANEYVTALVIVAITI